MRARAARAAFAAIAVVLTLAAPGGAPTAAGGQAPPAAADAEARRVAERAFAALGGAEGWSGVRLVQFSFAGRRSHAWDRSTGRHRVEGQTRDGGEYVVIHDLDTRRGRAWVDGEEVTGERAAELLENAYAAWVNDTYWLLMPMKLLDPGVHLEYVGREAVDGVEHDLLTLTFGGVGLTPGDRYWAWIDRSSGLMTRWAYRLQSQPENAEPTAWEWLGWRWYEVGEHRVRLADERVQVGGERVLDLAPIELSDRVPDGLFDAP